MRPISPLSGATLLGANVLFRWAGEAAHLELARDRSFRSVEQRSPAGATSGLVLRLDRGIWFWRLVGPDGSKSAVWGFDITGSSTAAHAPSLSLAADYNCDLLADLSVQYGVVLGRAGPIPEHPLTALDIGAQAAPELIRAATDQPYTWNFPEPAGDVNGDGCADMTAQVARQSSTRLEDNVPVRLFFSGRQDIADTWSATGRARHGSTALGDLNDDGYADVAECEDPQHGQCLVFAGSPRGLGDQPLFLLPKYQRLLGGADLNGDDRGDLVGVSKDGSIDFYAGPLESAPRAATRSWQVRPAWSAFVALGDLDRDGQIDIWGKGSVAREGMPGTSDATLWMIGGRDLSDAKEPRILGAFAWQVSDDLAFVPGVGPHRAGILVRSTDLGNDFAFAQESFPFPLNSRGRNKPRYPSALSQVGLQSSGDFNGDGWSDLLVTRESAAEDVVSEIYYGGARQFFVHAPIAPSEGLPVSGGFVSGGPARSPF